MTQYYFLATALPYLEFGVQPELSFEDLEILMKENLSSSDAAQVRLLRRYYDLLNLRALWWGKELDPHGNWTEAELEEVMLEADNIPLYLANFLARYEDVHERISHFPMLLSQYFKEEASSAKGLIRDYLKMEREMRLVLVAFRAKKLGRNLLQELQYEDPEEPLIAELLAQKDDAEYHPPEGYQTLKPIFVEYADDPMGLQQSLLQWRFERIQELAGLHPFSFDFVAGYLLRFILLENWLELDAEKGTEMIDSIVEEKA